MTASTKKRVFVYFGIGLSLLFLWLSLRQADFDEIVSALSRANLSFVAPFLCIYGLYYWLKAFRWQLLLSEGQGDTSLLFRIVIIGYAGNTLLPLRLGELVRIYIAEKLTGIRYSILLSSIAIEHIFDFVLILCVLAVVLLLYVDIPIMVTASSVLAALTLGAIAMYIVFAKWTKEVTDFLTWIFSGTSESFRANIHQQIQYVSRGVNNIGQPIRLAQVMVVTLVQWAIMLVCIYISLSALDLDLPISASLTVLAVTVIAIIIPTSPGDVGAIQLAYVLALQPYGTSASDAFAASLFFHVLTSASVVLLGSVYLRSIGFSMRQARESAERINLDEVPP